MPRKMKQSVPKNDAEMTQQVPEEGEKMELTVPQNSEEQPTSRVTPAKRYTENPFMDSMIVMTKKKKLTVARGSHIIDMNTGEIEGHTEIVQVIDVDKEQFVKLFTKDLAVWFDLSRAAQKSLAYALKSLGTKSINKDTVMLDFTPEVETEHKMSRTGFFRGVNELIDRQVLAKHKLQGLYFINPALVFNGDRARFVREYRVRRTTPPDVKAREELEARGQQRLDMGN